MMIPAINRRILTKHKGVREGDGVQFKTFIYFLIFEDKQGEGKHLTNMKILQITVCGEYQYLVGHTDSHFRRFKRKL